MTTDTSEYLEFANQLADAAGETLRPHFRAGVMATAKTDGSPVTVADCAAELAMRTLIRSRYPEHGIFGEEAGRDNPEARLQWVLDPIDGTRAFIAGYPTFTTLIALCEDGVPVAGVIDQPYLRERWAAARGGTSSKKMVASVPKSISIATTSMPYFSPKQQAAFTRAATGHTVTLGGDAYAYAMLASGILHAVIDAGFKPYDFCALVPVVEAAGGIITDWQGKPLTLASDGEVLAACTPELHRQLLASLSA